MAVALGVFSLVTGCNTDAPATSAPPEALCPAIMKGEGTTEFPLSGLYIMRNQAGDGWRNFPFAGDAKRKEWTLTQGKDVSYRAACEYDGEIIGVDIDPAYQRCWLEQDPGTGGSTTTWCAR